jgi:hypothetical protein
MKILSFVLTFLFFFGCSRGRPSKEPPIHINPNMDEQPKYEAMEESKFFLNHSAMRMPLPGTVARGQLDANTVYYQGKNPDGTFVKQSPLQITLALLKHGQERFNIYCSPCHDRTGSGQGIVIKKGFLPPPSFHLDRLRQVEDGYIFNVITSGIRNMPSYQYQVAVADRWAIVSYIRALQRSEDATARDVPEEIRKSLK